MSKAKSAGCLIISLLVGLLIVGDIGSGGTYVFQVPNYLLFGWMYYLSRVAPEIRPDPATVATAGICLIAVTLGCHWFGRWLWSNVRPDGPAWSWRWTARVVATVVLLFVAGTAAVGIVHQSLWLATSKEPLIERGRPFTIRVVSGNSMKQMGLATHNAFDATGFLPVSTFTPDGRPMHSW